MRTTDYVKLLESFANGHITASEFEKKFLDLNREDKNVYSEEINSILSKLFVTIDSFCENQYLRDEGDINENQLHDHVLVALTNLKHFLK